MKAVLSPSLCLLVGERTAAKFHKRKKPCFVLVLVAAVGSLKRGYRTNLLSEFGGNFRAKSDLPHHRLLRMADFPEEIIQQMKMSKVGNQTNSNDPQAVNSRVFVGNLNTYQVSKEDVERMFKRFGRIAGISMHKGYAFVQFTNPYDAHNAVASEDGAVVCGQTLDVNMVAEPKAHQTGRKRQNLTNTGNDWDYYYDSYSVGHQRLTPPTKRARMGTGNNQKRSKSTKSTKSSSKSSSSNIIYAQLNSYNTPDILICGNCKETFSGIQKLVEHKKTKCRLRFACRCHSSDSRKGKESVTDGGEPSSLICATCKDKFSSAWELIHHVQNAHEVIIYELQSSSDVGSSDEMNSSVGNNIKEELDDDDDQGGGGIPDGASDGNTEDGVWNDNAADGDLEQFS